MRRQGSGAVLPNQAEQRGVGARSYTEGPAGEGYLLFARAGTLMAQRLNTGKRALSGEAFPVMERVGVDPRGRAPFAVSGNGMLVVEPGSSAPARLAWMDRTGKRLEWVGEPGDVGIGLEPVLSPDENQVAFHLKGDVRVRDLAHGLSTRLTFGSRLDRTPVWSPDGGRIVFTAFRDTGQIDLYVKSASGAGQEELLLTSGNDKRASDWAGGGRGVLYRETDPKTKRDLWVLPMEGERKPTPFLRTEFNETDGAFSPDGKWVAYASDESGRNEIYVQPYPATGAKWQVSTGGGRWPRWRGDGRELYWLEEDGTLSAAEVNVGLTLRPGNPQALFETRIDVAFFERYAVAKDGKRFLVPAPVDEGEGPRPLTVIQNWLARARK